MTAKARNKRDQAPRQIIQDSLDYGINQSKAKSKVAGRCRISGGDARLHGKIRRRSPSSIPISACRIPLLLSSRPAVARPHADAPSVSPSRRNTNSGRMTRERETAGCSTEPRDPSREHGARYQARFGVDTLCKAEKRKASDCQLRWPRAGPLPSSRRRLGLRPGRGSRPLS